MPCAGITARHWRSAPLGQNSRTRSLSMADCARASDEDRTRGEESGGKRRNTRLSSESSSARPQNRSKIRRRREVGLLGILDGLTIQRSHRKPKLGRRRSRRSIPTARTVSNVSKPICQRIDQINSWPKYSADESAAHFPRPQPPNRPNFRSASTIVDSVKKSGLTQFHSLPRMETVFNSGTRPENPSNSNFLRSSCPHTCCCLPLC